MDGHNSRGCRVAVSCDVILYVAISYLGLRLIGHKPQWQWRRPLAKGNTKWGNTKKYGKKK